MHFSVGVEMEAFETFFEIRHVLSKEGGERRAYAMDVRTRYNIGVNKIVPFISSHEIESLSHSDIKLRDFI